MLTLTRRHASKSWVICPRNSLVKRSTIRYIQRTEGGGGDTPAIENVTSSPRAIASQMQFSIHKSWERNSEQEEAIMARAEEISIAAAEQKQ